MIKKKRWHMPILQINTTKKKKKKNSHSHASNAKFQNNKRRMQKHVLVCHTCLNLTWYKMITSNKQTNKKNQTYIIIIYIYILNISCFASLIYPSVLCFVLIFSFVFFGHTMLIAFAFYYNVIFQQLTNTKSYYHWASYWWYCLS